MTLITENEIEFKKFLNDGFASGAFQLKLKVLSEHRKNQKIRMLVYKKRDNNKVRLFKKGDKREFAVYNKESNIMYTDNANEIVSLRIKYSESKETPVNSDNHSSGKTKPFELETNTATVVVSNEIEPEGVAAAATVDTTQPSMRSVNAIKEVLERELNSAKKVWAILENGEEIQLENSIYEESDASYLGTAKNSVKLLDIKQLRFRKKTYL